jgi:hypothetical protein
MNKIFEAIATEADLLPKLKPLFEAEIFDFMKSLRGGTFFNMGLYSFIPVSRAYKKTIRIYKVLNQTAIVSGVSYENIGTTKDFRDQTGKAPGGAWYDHMPGYENRIGVKKSDPNCKYVLWDIKAGSDCWVRYYVVEIDSGKVTPVSKEDVINSAFLTPSEKKALEATPSTGFNLTTGEVVENKTKWRTAAFEHIFWLSRGGTNPREYGAKFMESACVMNSNKLTEEVGTELFRDAHANVDVDLDAILSGSMDESFEKQLMHESMPAAEAVDPVNYEMIAARAMHFMRINCDMEYVDIADELGIDVQEVLDLIGPDSYDDSDIMLEAIEEIEPYISTKNVTSAFREESDKLTESYRRTISRGKTLNENELFVNFD